MYIDVQLLSKPLSLPLVGLPNHYSTLLTTTLYHPMVWMDYCVKNKRTNKPKGVASELKLYS